MNYEATLEFARRCDEADVLRDFRKRFSMPQDARGADLIYLAGHSLGLQPLAARERVLEELDDWARLGVLGHEGSRRPWIRYHETVAPGLQYLTGAREGEVVAMNSLTVNIHLMLATFFRPAGERVKILIERGAFSSDRHAVTSQLRWHGLDPEKHLIELAPREGEDLVTTEAIEELLQQRGKEIALVLWPGVQFRTGQSFDIPRITRAAHRAGCVIGFDLAHSIGNTPLQLHDADADFAVWCSYKYLNSGPGAIAGCFIAERHTSAPGKNRLAGWWGHELQTRFVMGPQFKAAPGAAGWQISNPPILATAPLLASLELFQEARMERLRAKSLALTGFLEFLTGRYSGSVQRVTPADPEARGCQLSLRILGGTSRGKRVFDWLSARGVVSDWREPDIIRVAPVPLYNSFEDVFRFGELLGEALQANP